MEVPLQLVDRFQCMIAATLYTDELCFRIANQNLIPLITLAPERKDKYFGRHLRFEKKNHVNVQIIQVSTSIFYQFAD